MVSLSSCIGRSDPWIWITTVLLGVLINLKEVWLYNLDSSVPIVKRSSNPQSYFGFSVAHHLISEGGNEHVIIVGAPRENISTHNIVEPGAIYKCPLTSRNNDCTRLIVDDDTSAQGRQDKSNQWFGVSVASQNSADGLAIACAHRYKKSGPSYVWGLGICFTLSNALEEITTYEPCNSKPTGKAHEEYGFCQAGTSVALLKNGDILIGAPGPNTWTGDLFIYSSDDLEWYESVTENLTPHNSYLGMSVRYAEKIFGNGSSSFIGGAPKSRYYGEIFLYRQGPNRGVDSQLLFVQRLSGDQFYSGFGYDFIVGDFNGDGKNDLVVGAPFYREQRESASSYEHGIGGAIYVYFNVRWGFTSKPIKITSRRMREAECEALRCYDARFGFSLATIGDLDGDGYQDFVVGAPFEGNGAIYIFRGSPTSKIETYSQRIAAADVRGTSLKSFGYSLAGGSDIDGNTYPDLTVGAYQSDTVVVLRARPVVNVFTTLESNPKQIDPKRTNCSSDGKAFNCLTITVCLRFSAEPKNKFLAKLPIKYRLEAEKFTGTKAVRIFFGDDAEKYFLENTVSMKEQNQPGSECTSHVAYLRKNTRDFLSPVAFRLIYELPDSRPPAMNPGQPLPEFYTYPVLNQTTSSKDLQVSFIKNCGQDEICNSDLKLSANLKLPIDPSGGFLLKLGEVPEIRLNVSVTNNGEDAHETVLWVSLPENINMLGVESKDNELSCTPVDNNRKLECHIGNPVAGKETVSIEIRLNPNRLSNAQSNIIIGVSVNTTSVESDVTDDTLNLQITVTTIIDLAVIGSSDPNTAYYAKDPQQQQDYKPVKEEDIGPEIVHKFEVKNTGKVVVEESNLTITWPLQVINSANQKLHLLYIMDIQVKGNSRQEEGARCTVDPKFVNPDKVTVKVSNPNSITDVRGVSLDDNKQLMRRKRATTQNYEPGIGDLVCGKSSKVVCIPITCKVFELRPAESVLISIRARLWNRTIASTFPDAYEVLVRSTASIAIDQTGLNIKQSNTTNDVGQAGTKLISSTKPPKEVAIWIIILAVCAGILLLVALIILLLKCGFFKRNKPDFHKAHVAKSIDAEESQQQAAAG